MMTSEEALQLIEATLESKTGKQLTLSEKQILKAAWNNETYTSVAETLYLSLGYIKDLASALWHRLSNIYGEKISKNNFRRVMEKHGATVASLQGKRAKNDTDLAESSKGHILIIDRSIENLEFLTKVLSQRGYRVRGVTSSRMAAITVRHHPPDVILLDIEMSKIYASELYQALNADESTSEIPMILLNLRGEVSEQLKLFKAGGLNQILSPLELEEVISGSQSKLTLQEQRDPLRNKVEQHQQTAENLYQSRTLLANLFNGCKDGIAAWEAVRDATTEEIQDFRCLVANPAFAKLLGQKREDLIGQTIEKRSIARLTPTLFEALVEVVETGEEIEQEFYWENDDQQFWYCLNAVKFGDGCSITVRNITNFKIFELKMKLGVQFQ